MTFLQKSYGEYSKVEKPVLVTKDYEGSDDEEELETLQIINDNNNSYIVIDFNGNTDIKNGNKNCFDKDIDNEVEATPKTTINTKVVQAMKKLQALFNNSANKVIKQATQQKKAIENSNILISLPC